MDRNLQRFQQRVGRINQTHPDELPGRSYMQPDGLIVQRAPRSRFRPRIPIKSIMLAVICCFMLKGFMIWNQGAAAYADRLVVLQDGNAGSQISASLLAMDPVSMFLAEQITVVLGPAPQ